MKATILLIVLAAGLAGCSSPPVACDLAQSNKLVETATTNGWVIGRHNNGIIADEMQWRQLSLGTKLKLAQAVACQMASGGDIASHYVSVRGSDGVTMIASGIPGVGQFSDK